MKKSLALALIISMISTSVMSGEFWNKHKESFGMTYIGVSVVIGVYGTTGAGAAIAVGATLAAATTQAEIRANKQSAAKLLLNDSQAFFQSGEMSLALKDAVDQIKNQTTDLSDLEALDILNESALSILSDEL